MNAPAVRDAVQFEDTLLQDVFAAFPDGVLVVHPGSLRVVACNRGACELLGYAADVLRGLEITSIESSIENIFYWDEVKGGNLESLDESTGYYRRSDSSIIAIKRRISVVERATGPALLIIFSEDKQAAVRHEDRLHSAALLAGTLEATADGILVTRMDGGISNINHRFAQMWQVPGSLLDAGDDAAIFAHIQSQAEDARQYDDDLADAVRNTDSDTLHTVQLKDGRIFERYTTPLQYDGQLAGFVFSFRDITERQHMVMTLSAKNIELEKASRVKSEFLANMSHEIRTPMNAIIGLSRLCLGTGLNNVQRDYVEKIFHAGESLLGIINDVLDFSKIEAGKVAIESTPFRLDEVFERVDHLMRRAAEDKGLQFLIRRHFVEVPELGEQLSGDPLRLGQVLLNLLSNAIKFTDTGTVRVDVSAPQVSATSATLEFSVSDTGIGLTQDQCQRLFRSFTQADASTTRKYGGTGLGLAICKSLVELMGGAIQVKSKPNDGTTFTFSIKCGRNVAQKQVHRERKAESWQIGQREDIRGAHVMVVEDNRINQQIARELLIQAGLNVVVAQNGLEAVAMLERYAFDAILMDMQMPVMDGLEATRTIRSRSQYQDLPIIAMTANAMTDDVERCHDAGMNDHVSKPIDPEMLFDALQKWIRPGKRTAYVTNETAAETEAPFVIPGDQLDMEAAVKSVGGNYALLRSLLQVFWRDHRDDGAALENAVISGDVQRAQRLVHTLKGIAGSIGATRLYTCAKDLEAFMRANGELVTADVIRDFKSALADVVSVVGAFLQNATTDHRREEKAIHSVSQPKSAQPSVLIVDDDEMILMMLSAVLKSEYQIATASSGAAALNACRSQTFDLILLDVTMEDMDGYEVCRQLKGEPSTRTVPVVFVTGMDADEDRKTGAEAGGNGYLLKPIKRDAVLACVRQQLHNK